ncbi:putative uncharacterized protein [Bacteroides sp. CAG:661]|nr:putative uncharacterized protein [Bacteroides sp. CAG:661]
MNVKIQISDEAYKALMNGNGRLEGSLGLVSPTEGNFNAYRRNASKPGNKYIKLPHGRASVGDSHVRLTLRIALDEADITPADVLIDESHGGQLQRLPPQRVEARQQVHQTAPRTGQCGRQPRAAHPAHRSGRGGHHAGRRAHRREPPGERLRGSGV